MFRVRYVCLLLALTCVLSFGGVAMAAEVDCDTTYCFTPADFSEDDTLAGVCITHLPEVQTGTIMLGSRVIRSGDILTAEQLSQLTFSPLLTETDQDAVVTYLPIYEDRVEASTTTTIAVRGKTDEAPVAQDSAMETYKNLPNNGTLTVNDPEGKELIFTLVRQPKRGEVVINDDGTFTYTPKKNKVGVDSFTYTAADPAGNVSREATVTITILKPTDAKQYTDTIGLDCRFAAEWLRNTGLFVGERVAGENCFSPDKTVSRGEFISMLVQALEIPVEEVSYESVPEDTPDWLKPYLAAAMRAGLTAGLPERETDSFGADEAITGAEAAVMIQNALDLSTAMTAVETDVQEDAQTPAWAATSLAVMAENGVTFSATEAVTRGQLAQAMYQISKLAEDAPGVAVIRMQQ